VAATEYPERYPGGGVTNTSRYILQKSKRKPSFQVIFLKNDRYQSVHVDEVKEVDFPEIKGHLERGESVFITRLGTRGEITNHGRHIARELESCVEVPL
jgi:hypothetical protein